MLFLLPDCFLKWISLTAPKIATFTLTEPKIEDRLKVCQDKCRANAKCVSWGLQRSTRVCSLSQVSLYTRDGNGYSKDHYSGMRECKRTKLGAGREGRVLFNNRDYVLV